MSARKTWKILVLLAAILLDACAAPSYRFNNQTYTSRDEAWAGVLRANAEADAAIPAGATALVDRKLLVVVPTAAALSKTFQAIVEKRGQQYARVGTPARTQDDFNTDAANYNYKSVASSLKKAKIYREVEVIEVDTTTPNVQPSSTQDVMAFFLGADNPVMTVYFISAKAGRQIVAVDNGASSLAERRKSAVDDLKSKALQ